MKIKVRHKNGTPLYFTVTIDELTDEMRDKLIVPAGTTVKDYRDFDVSCNKHGKVCAIRPGMYSEEMSRRIREQSMKPSLIDVFKATYRHDGKAIEKINHAADEAGIGHAEAKRLLDGAFIKEQ